MSNPSVSQMRLWASNSHTLGDTAIKVDGLVDSFDNSMNAMTRDVDAVMTGWKGDAARASQTATDSEKQISNRLGMGILQMTDILNQLAPNFQSSCDEAKRVVDQLQAAGYVVADNGVVSPPPAPRGGWPTDVSAGATPAEAADIAAANAATHSSAVQRALQAVGSADAQIAQQVKTAAAALDQAADRATSPVAVSPEVQAVLDGSATLPTDPNALNHFWNTLTANDKAALWNHDRNVGNLDGIPAADRDHFNRRHVPELQHDAEEKAQRELAALGPKPEFHRSPGFPKEEDSTAYKEWVSRRDEILRPVEGWKSLESKINDANKPPRFLLTARDNGQVSVAVNNPDTAKNVSTYVPGTGTNLGSAGGNIDRADKMLDSALNYDGSPTSVITWQDYNAPQNPITESPSMSYARAAAGNLDHFQDGLAATHLGEGPSHSTVLGHSYGTTVVGQAATGDHVLNTDQVIMVASPGFGGAEGVDDFNLTGVPSDDMSDRVWSTYSNLDPMNGVPEVLLGPRPYNVVFGGSFQGANDFESDWSGGHSDYWTDGNSALENFGRLIAGQMTKDDK